MITTVTLNASIDKAYFMDEKIQGGTVMRVSSCRNSAGGKGLNVARIIKLCEENVKAVGMAGGFNGSYLEYLLDQDQVNHAFTHIKGETRSCINVLDERFGSTEFLEPGCEVSKEEEAVFWDDYQKVVKESDVITISGSVPSGMSFDIYERMITFAKAQGKQVILDTSGNLLAKGIKAAPTIVKPNRDELEMLFGMKVQDMQEVVAAAKCIQCKGIEYVIVSLGSDGALLVCEQGAFKGTPPKLEAANTVGCGDSMVGALSVGFKRNYNPEELIRFAVAVASANALSPNTGDFQIQDCERIREQVVIEKI